ncbi:Eisosome component PIL1-domain-containing protein [Sparassis latifolia]|uniref:Sphingolipid long chain base-responsive protein n=1 Tax=Sparassis crispa TaxID=139825 RepID=A0A401G6T8_9APHY|nr:hypothetical protein SCP_0107640 [Sparassis crispa]GBE77882.1 hypothetical protein SCP_0107640 [Sparassis crispa]
MSNFFASLTDKAQSALNASPLAQHLPSSITGQGSTDNAGGPLKSHTFETIHHQLRTFQQQYSTSTTPVQRVITTAKGVAIDFDSYSRDSLAHSKELYTWSQQEDADIRDVTDRLAWINYVEGSLASHLATKLNTSRAPFKALRDAEATLSARRNIRNGLKNQIGRLEHEQARGVEPRLSELRRQLQVAETEDEPLEKQVELLKRKAVAESERQKWAAMNEYAEKLLLLSQAANAVLPVLSGVPPTEKQPYTGGEATASVRAVLQHALDNYTAGTTTLQLPPAVDLSRSDTRSFGLTHAQELSRIGSADQSIRPGIPVTPPPTDVGGAPQPAPSDKSNASVQAGQSSQGAGSTSPPLRFSPPPQRTSPPLNPAMLNQTPAPIPIPASTASPIVAPNPMDPTVKIPSAMPTVAETGMPQFAGSAGPGPASGSLRDLRSGKSPVPKQGSGADKLPGYTNPSMTPSDQQQGVPGAPLAKYEKAEEEKKRLEREERERVLAASSSGAAEKHPPVDKDGDQPPSYEEI